VTARGRAPRAALREAGAWAISKAVRGALVAALAATATAVPAGAAPPRVPGMSAQDNPPPRVIIVVGIGGTPAYRARFGAWAEELRAALVERLGVPPDHVTYLGDRPVSGAPPMAARATRAHVLETLAELGRTIGPREPLILILIGHGTSRRGQARFNLPGPDLSAADLAQGLGAFPTQPLALIHTASASGGFLAPLSGPNRVIVTATATARERNATMFPRFFIEALAKDGSDLDKDGRVSLLEAFAYARRNVARFYERENRIATEHAVLDDDGDGKASAEPSPSGPDGRLAASFVLGRVPRRGAPPRVTGSPSVAEPPSGNERANAAGDSVLARLSRERAAIQARLDTLRASKGALPEERYRADLEALLIELALKNREIRARAGGGS